MLHKPQGSLEISVEASCEVSFGYSNGLFCCLIDGGGIMQFLMTIWVGDKIVVIL